MKIKNLRGMCIRSPFEALLPRNGTAGMSRKRLRRYERGETGNEVCRARDEWLFRNRLERTHERMVCARAIRISEREPAGNRSRCSSRQHLLELAAADRHRQLGRVVQHH